MERAKRIELSSVAWEATALPLSYARGPTRILSFGQEVTDASLAVRS